MRNVVIASVLLSLLPAVAHAAPASAEAVLEAKGGSGVGGTIEFSEANGSVTVGGTVSGLTPGKHGFHIHEVGDCSADDASSAGGHFNPTKGPHAGPSDSPRHSGDLGNIDADDKGAAKLSVTDSMLHLSGEQTIIGRSVVVHKGQDDLKTQPSGGSGDRIACGVIRAK